MMAYKAILKMNMDMFSVSAYGDTEHYLFLKLKSKYLFFILKTGSFKDRVNKLRRPACETRRDPELE